jgi:low temperature requirement protein LtrA
VLLSQDVEFDADHMLERCRLFLIVALGETILSTGTAIANAPRSAMTVLTGTSALVVVVALWALYFVGSDQLVNRHLATTTDPLLAARLATNGEVVVVAGLIAVAVGSELAITHPHGTTTINLSLLLFGGPFLYLLVQIWYLRVATRALSPRRLGGLAALVAGAGLSLLLPPFAAIALVAATLVALVIIVLQHNRLWMQQPGGKHPEPPDLTGRQ